MSCDNTPSSAPSSALSSRSAFASAHGFVSSTNPFAARTTSNAAARPLCSR